MKNNITPLFLNLIWKVTPLFLTAIKLGAWKLYKTVWNDSVTFHIILSKLRISLSLLFTLSGSTPCLLLTLLWLDIAFNVFHIWCARGMNLKHIQMKQITSPATSTYDSLIAKLSHIGSTPIPQFFCLL